MSTVPVPTFGATGFIVPSDADILTAVKNDINAIFGGGLNMADATPQGQLANTITALISQSYSTFLLYTQLSDPAYAFGRMQDAIGRIYFIERDPSLPTVVQATCNGAQGVVIPAGSQAQASDGNLYTCTAGGTIPASGSIILPFSCNAVGPIPCVAGSLTTIYRAIPGWDSIINQSDGVLGRDVETRAEFEARRALSVAQNSAGSLPSVLGAVLTVDGVLDAYVTENVNATPLTIGGFTLAPKSIYVAVVGGEATSIAQAIWTKKAPGAAYNGNTSVTVEDTSPTYNPPYPSYSVSFEIPPALPFVFDIELTNNNSVPANAAALIQAAIITAFAGGDGGPRARVGSTVYASRFYSTVASLGTWVALKSVKIGSVNTPLAIFTASVATNVMTVTAITSGTLAIGQTIQGANLLPGTTILAQLTGSAGSTGTYTISSAQTVVPSTITALKANQDFVIVGIAQTPTLNANDIKVGLS